MKVQRITNQLKKDYMKYKLSTTPSWAVKALMLVYKHQTVEERAIQHTVDPNGKGFTGHDAEFLTSLSKQYDKRKTLSQKQLAHVLRKIPKYWKQVLRVTNEKQLVDCMLKDKWISETDYEAYKEQLFLKNI